MQDDHATHGQNRATRTTGLRIGDVARAEAAEALGRHYAAGRLDHVEYEERLEAVFRARVATDLDVVQLDLPRLATPRDRRRRRRAAVAALRGWLGLCTFFVLLWAFTAGPGSTFWPIWPILGTATCAIPTALAVLRGERDERGRPVDNGDPGVAHLTDGPRHRDR